ncbi:hypothetical protein AY599_21300 [Leptolyngbya valderiana BDU 20041]|nr:hypothetical protein AY599_21300 [Leptolyngbya valderiana BDU 20041]
MGRMDISLDIFIAVMATMKIDPPNRIALTGHRPQNRQNAPSFDTRFKGFMRQQAMISHGDASHRNNMHSHQQADIQKGDVQNTCKQTNSDKKRSRTIDNDNQKF